MEQLVLRLKDHKWEALCKWLNLVISGNVSSRADEEFFSETGFKKLIYSLKQKPLCERIVLWQISEVKMKGKKAALILNKQLMLLLYQNYFFFENVSFNFKTFSLFQILTKTIVKIFFKIQPFINDL